MIRTLLFLRAWHAELRVWKFGLQRRLGKMPQISEDNLDNMHKFAMHCWGDFARGYVRGHD
jgi:hypothetical protein